MTTEPKLDKSNITNLIHAAEVRNGFFMNPHDFDFLQMAIESFVTAAIDKFVAGAKEHFEDTVTPSNFVEAVNHKQEIQKEAIDLWMYIKGLERKKQ